MDRVAKEIQYYGEYHNIKSKCITYHFIILISYLIIGQPVQSRELVILILKVNVQILPVNISEIPCISMQGC
jgi:hypothetical protein